MGLEDLKKSFDGAITAAANAASDATSIAKKSIQSIDISDAKKVQEKAAAALQSAKNTASDFAENAGAAVSDLVARTTSDENERINGIALQDDRISKIGATRILYYLMAADGDVKPEELEKFDLIGNALLQNYAQIRDSLLQQCEDATSKINENDSRTDAINDLVDKEIETAESSDDDLMDPSLLVWNMLVTAMSDQDYAEPEIEIASHAATSLGIRRDRIRAFRSRARGLLAQDIRQAVFASCPSRGRSREASRNHIQKHSRPHRSLRRIPCLCQCSSSEPRWQPVEPESSNQLKQASTPVPRQK